MYERRSQPPHFTPHLIQAMKLPYMSAAIVAAASLLFSSCVYSAGGGYGTISYATDGYSSSVAWTNASYDANGFPIFGYSYGRPVYGYTEAGVAIFTVAALTALCFVPHWAPAPWYHGHWHYPAHIHRCAAPPRFPHGHNPGHRPAGGLNAPIHRNPGAVFKPHGNNRPGAMHHAAPRPQVGNNRPGGAKPGVNHQPGRLNTGAAPNNRPANKPQAGNSRPGNNRPNMGSRPAARPNAGSQPNMGNRQQSRPAGQNMSSRPQSRPSMGARPAAASRPSMGSSRPSGASRPSMGGSRPSGVSRPSMGGSRPSGGGRGHGGPRR